MPQDIVTFRPRAGATYTLASGATQVVSVPAGSSVVNIVCTLSPGRVAVGTAGAAPGLSDAVYGYIAANIPITLKLVGETKIYLGSGIASNVFYLTFGN